MGDSAEKPGTLYNLEVKYKGTSDKVSFMDTGILIPQFLADHVFGHKKNFFLDENIIKRSNGGFLLQYGRDFNLIVQKNRKKQTYSLQLKSVITPLDEVKRILLRLWRGKTPYIILTLKSLQYESLVKIYELFDKIPTIDDFPLEDVELNAQWAREANYTMPFVFLSISGCMGFLMTIAEGNRFLWIFNAFYTIFHMIGLVLFDLKKPKSDSFFKKMKIFYVLSAFVFLGINLSFSTLI